MILKSCIFLFSHRQPLRHDTVPRPGQPWFIGTGIFLPLQRTGIRASILKRELVGTPIIRYTHKMLAVVPFMAPLMQVRC